MQKATTDREIVRVVLALTCEGTLSGAAINKVKRLLIRQSRNCDGRPDEEWIERHISEGRAEIEGAKIRVAVVGPDPFGWRAEATRREEAEREEARRIEAEDLGALRRGTIAEPLDPREEHRGPRPLSRDEVERRRKARTERRPGDPGSISAPVDLTKGAA
jgi:hypothetical protein